MIGEESVPLEVLSFFVGNNNPKKGLSPLIFRFLFRYLLQISEKGVPCANAMAEIIPNEPGRVMPLREKQKTPAILNHQYFRGFLIKINI